MSYKEALEDNVPTRKINGDNYYYPPCHICGDGVRSWAYIRGTQYTCPTCKSIIALKKLEEAKLMNNPKRQNALDKAIKRISKVANIKNYEEPVAKIKESINDSIWFGSTEEVMVALQLLKKGIRFISQYKINLYRCDFYLPDLKVVLEIDGDLFHTKDKKRYEEDRDKTIVDVLGEGTEVIRIKTSLINLNVTRVTNAIYGVLKLLLKKDS